jgi:hypothetical protein
MPSTLSDTPVSLVSRGLDVGLRDESIDNFAYEFFTPAVDALHRIHHSGTAMLLHRDYAVWQRS